jgi:hypothetical protein
MKKALLIISSMALIAAAFISPATAAEFHGSTCSLTGEATLKPGLSMESGEYKVAFTGELTDCQSTTSDATSGAVKAKAVATGTCGEATAEGVATITWDTDAKTTVEFSTTDIGALVILQGEVTKSNDTGLLTGDSVFGALAFNADPAECMGDGISEASFNGQVVGGYPQ